MPALPLRVQLQALLTDIAVAEYKETGSYPPPPPADEVSLSKHTLRTLSLLIECATFDVKRQSRPGVSHG